MDTIIHIKLIFIREVFKTSVKSPLVWQPIESH